MNWTTNPIGAFHDGPLLPGSHISQFFFIGCPGARWSPSSLLHPELCLSLWVGRARPAHIAAVNTHTQLLYLCFFLFSLHNFTIPTCLHSDPFLNVILKSREHDLPHSCRGDLVKLSSTAAGRKHTSPCSQPWLCLRDIYPRLSRVWWQKTKTVLGSFT